MWYAGLIARLTLFFLYRDQEGSSVYMLYIDDSGLSTDKQDKYCVLAGFATREDKNYWIQKNIDALVTDHTGRSDIELHGSHIRSGKGIWRGFPKEQREDLLRAVLHTIAKNYPKQYILFGAVVENQGDDVAEELFTQITSRFDKFLKRKFAKRKEAARGIAIFDKSRQEQQFQLWSKMFQRTGNHWGETLANFAEVPLFLDSTMSRSIQIADIIAYALFRKYQYSDDSYFSIIQSCFDKEGGHEHGLYCPY
jgi:ribosomal protein S20